MRDTLTKPYLNTQPIFNSHLNLVEDEGPAPETAHHHSHGHAFAVGEPSHANRHGWYECDALERKQENICQMCFVKLLRSMNCVWNVVNVQKTRR
jgi:hypothetical protein